MLMAKGSTRKKRKKGYYCFYVKDTGENLVVSIRYMSK